jgi:transposase
MDIFHTHVAGIDVHKEQITVTTMVGKPGEVVKVEQFQCKTFTDDLRVLGEKLLSAGIKEIAMESSGIFWKPVHNVLKPMGFKITLANARHIKNVPGRKTDVKDSQWIAQLHRNGLIQASYIPETEYQQMRTLTRYRNGLVEDISRIKNRLQKVLEDGNIKLGSVLSDVFGKGGLAVVEALSQEITSPKQLADRVQTNIKRREDLEKSLTHCLRKDHLFLIREYFNQYRQLKGNLDRVDIEISKYNERHEPLLKKLEEVPGISKIIAEGILAEASAEMKNFKDERTFAAWAGVAPGNNESAGKKKDPNLGKAIPILRNI